MVLAVHALLAFAGVTSDHPNPLLRSISVARNVTPIATCWPVAGFAADPVGAEPCWIERYLVTLRPGTFVVSNAPATKSSAAVYVSAVALCVMPKAAIIVVEARIIAVNRLIIFFRFEMVVPTSFSFSQ